MFVGHVVKVLLQKLLKDMYPRYDSHIFAEIPMGSAQKKELYIARGFFYYN